jgi:hypothetical protein
MLGDDESEQADQDTSNVKAAAHWDSRDADRPTKAGPR